MAREIVVGVFVVVSFLVKVLGDPVDSIYSAAFDFLLESLLVGITLFLARINMKERVKRLLAMMTGPTKQACPVGMLMSQTIKARILSTTLMDKNFRLLERACGFQHS